MTALLDACEHPNYPATPALVLSNVADAAGLTSAAARGAPTAIVPHRDFGKDKAAFEAAMQAQLEAHDVELVCLAGFMRVLTAAFVERWSGRMLNIHPSLLPLFKGLDTHARALAAGVKIHGASVHLVTPELDDGPILAQGAIPVTPADTPDSLAARLLPVEHRLYPAALAAYLGGVETTAATPADVLFSPPL
ncbi:MAG: phosphoribosylglycinamide formyltransferase [Neomegalonema sp.]|nr:phosphoribosylglycinamide formyltransferase [Neomegalonema sp.]